jgi:uncharacterized short protein YbdD (DUF466 family)
MPGLATRIKYSGQVIRYWIAEYFGENDYARYVAEWQARHAGLDNPEQTEHQMMTAREFYQYRLDIKYDKKMQRCC